MTFYELPKELQGEVLKEIIEMCKERDPEVDPELHAREYIEYKDDFRVVDYSPEEDGTDLRVEW